MICAFYLLLQFSRDDRYYNKNCHTGACPVEGALRVVGWAVVQRAVEGAFIKDRRHVAVGRQGCPQFWIDLCIVACIRAMEACR